MKEQEAREELERIRWPDGPVCPWDGSRKVYSIMAGGTTRRGLYKCAKCLRQFTVTVGTVLDKGHIAPERLLEAVDLVACQKLSANAMGKRMGMSYKTAWRLHKIIKLYE